MFFTQCPLCERLNPATAKFCEACGVGLVASCTTCGTVNDAGAGTCGGCAAPLPASAATAERPGPGPVFDVPRSPASRSFLVRFGADGSVNVDPVAGQTVPGTALLLNAAGVASSASRALALANDLNADTTVDTADTARRRRWAGPRTLAVSGAGMLALLLSLGLAGRAPPAGEPARPATASAPLAVPVLAPAALERSLADIERAPPAAGPSARAATPAAPAAKSKPKAAAPAVVRRPRPTPTAVVATPASPTASPESASTVAAALARTRGTAVPPPTPPRSSKLACADNAAALGLCPHDPKQP